ncbi:aldo/keto reductase [Limosilactobacillus fastidiosus]|uniref:Aldo/keto reductase n=1 Tax=Limosilactobacillus fastidiosus TaxID=2759855 RepID=A0A7W3TZ21_9LACO|nr:aldo/keto reductase [Limosilactobacillus fastidiosus]MBB1063391.1 aldo/keto reductase [Limosilactobacillus fastidiosus]MBB1085928.1 aldo/keto reductase [Limosilactobacillus fastidiosus]MCD7084659.1 aldo/keto reductase [Limosilactobacillus fastidiosus]MCD7085735.1 aldo/keto reductase [Limosilactobacillus fastidiosus]MCD7113812.1 aldo/keto reductase [Limosilactobacillus fastidiosus]
MDIQSNMLKLADGNQIPQEGFGLYKVTDRVTMRNSIQAAYQNGYRLFDTAQLYGNEKEVGQAFKDLDISRENIFVTTKVSEANQGYQRTINSVKESLKELQMDYIDLLLVHWPIQRAFFDTWQAFEELKKEGLTKSIGVSNFQIIHLQYLATQANEMPVVNQIELHPRLTQKPMLKYDQEHQIVTQAWSPLGRGAMLNIPELESIAKQHNKSTAQVILRWHLQNGVSFIPKSIHPKRIKQNADIYDFKLSADEMKQIDDLNQFFRTGREPELTYENNHQY